MPRRRQFRGIANAIANSFVSRNNDVGGYWALGILYLHAKQQSSLRLVIELKPERPDLGGEPFAAVARTYRNALAAHLVSLRLPFAWLASASVAVDFETAALKPLPFGLHTIGNPFDCRVSLVDDRGRAYETTVHGRCWPHDPNRESRSTRAASLYSGGLGGRLTRA